MRFRNSLRLLMENFKHVYKILLYKLVVLLLAAALCCAFVLPEVTEIWNSTAVQGLLENGKAFAKAFFAADTVRLAELKPLIVGKDGSFDQVASLLSSMTWELAWTCVGCVLVYLLSRFVDTLCYYTTGCALNDKMSAYAETGFGSAYIANLGRASCYALVYVPVVFLFDLCTVALCVGAIALFDVLFGMFFGVTLLVVLQAAKLTWTSHWLPGMTDGKKLSQALRYENKREKRQRWKVFSTYVVTIYIVAFVNIFAALFTFGSALLITVPASYFLFICEQYVNYYTMKGKRYFLTYEKVAQNPDKGDSEHFFEYLEDDNGEDSVVDDQTPTSEA